MERASNQGRSPSNSRFATCLRSRPMIAAEETMPLQAGARVFTGMTSARSGRPTAPPKPEAAAQREGEEQHRHAVGGEYNCGRSPPRAHTMKFTRITVNPQQMGGVPCIRGLRIPVASVV